MCSIEKKKVHLFEWKKNKIVAVYPIPESLPTSTWHQRSGYLMNRTMLVRAETILAVYDLFEGNQRLD